MDVKIKLYFSFLTKPSFRLRKSYLQKDNTLKTITKTKVTTHENMSTVQVS